jgi:hypothetical protein
VPAALPCFCVPAAAPPHLLLRGRRARRPLSHARPSHVVQRDGGIQDHAAAGCGLRARHLWRHVGLQVRSVTRAARAGAQARDGLCRRHAWLGVLWAAAVRLVWCRAAARQLRSCVLRVASWLPVRSSDDINKFLWMVRIGGGVFPVIKESDYLANVRAAETGTRLPAGTTKLSAQSASQRGSPAGRPDRPAPRVGSTTLRRSALAAASRLSCSACLRAGVFVRRRLATRARPCGCRDVPSCGCRDVPSCGCRDVPSCGCRDVPSLPALAGRLHGLQQGHADDAQLADVCAQVSRRPWALVRRRCCVPTRWSCGGPRAAWEACFLRRCRVVKEGFLGALPCGLTLPLARLCAVTTTLATS